MGEVGQAVCTRMATRTPTQAGTQGSHPEVSLALLLLGQYGHRGSTLRRPMSGDERYWRPVPLLEAVVQQTPTECVGQVSGSGIATAETASQHPLSSQVGDDSTQTMATQARSHDRGVRNG